MDTALGLTTASSSQIKSRYYDTLFLKVAEKKLVHKQLGQINRQIAKGEGGYGSGAVYWTKWVNLTTVTSGSGEGVPTSAVTLSAVSVTGTTAQYDNAVSISDIMAYVSFGDVMKAAIERLAYNAGISIDTVVRGQIYNSGTTLRVESAAHYSSITSTGTLTVGGVRRAVRSLHRNDAQELADGFYVAVVHPDQTYDLQGDTTTGGWIDANKYTDANAVKLLNGEIGKLYGVRFLETSNGAVIAGSSTYVGSATIYVASFFGRDAFGVTELQNLKTYIKDFGSAGAADPTNKIATAGWKTTFGAATLNSSFFVNYQSVATSTG